jgi:hypothetical protein
LFEKRFELLYDGRTATKELRAARYAKLTRKSGVEVIALPRYARSFIDCWDEAVRQGAIARVASGRELSELFESKRSVWFPSCKSNIELIRYFQNAMTMFPKLGFARRVP